MTTSATAQADFNTAFQGAVGNNVRPVVSLGAVEGKNFKETQDGADDNAFSVIHTEHRSPTAVIARHIAQRGSGAVHAVIEFGASTVEEFALILKMVGDGLAAVVSKAGTDDWDANAVPTFTTMTAEVTTVAASTEVQITLAQLKTQGNEADSDGTVDGFIVQAVSEGSLKIGASSGVAKAYAAQSNDRIDATHNAYYTAGVTTGSRNAFTIKAIDNKGWMSATAIQAKVTVS